MSTLADEKEIVLTGDAAAALNPSTRRRRGGGRKTRKGGDNSGALLQLAAQSTNRLRGGDNSGGLLQLAAQSQGNKFSPDTPAETAKAYAAAYTEAAKQLPLLAATTNQKGAGFNGAIVNLTSTRAPITPGAPEVKPVVSGQPVSDLGPAMSGGVILKPAKKQVRVSLKAPKKATIVSQTRKAPRKIRLGVKGLKTRLNRAKKAHAHAQTVSLPIVKQRLVKAGVIKASSKAPEPMLRTMYADLLVTKKGL